MGVLIRAFVYGSEKWDEIAFIGALPGLAVDIGTVGIGVLLLRPNSSRLSRVFGVGYAAIYVVGSAMQGHRGLLLRLVAMVALYVLLYPEMVWRNKRTVFVAAVSIGILFLVFVFPLVRAFKHSYSFTYGMTPAQRVERAWNTYVDIFAKGNEDDSGEPVHDPPALAVSRRLGLTLENFAILIQRTPQVWKYQYGKTITLVFLKFVPRALWKQKPDTNVDGAFYEDYLGMKRGLRGGGASMSTAGDFYLNFHILGIVAGMFIVGVLFRLFQQFCLGTHKDNRLVVGPLFCCIQVQTLGLLSSSISNLVGNVLLSAILVVWVTRMTRRRIVSGNGGNRGIRAVS
jgi:hypothetical protein